MEERKVTDDVDAGPWHHKALRSGVLVLLLNGLEKSFGLLRMVILARILLPEQFGLIGVCWFTIATFETFSQTGFGAALVQKTSNIDEYLDTAWLVQLARGALLYTGIFLSAPFVEGFFASEGAAGVLRVLGLTLLVSSLSNIGMVSYIRRIDFKRQVVLGLSSAVIDLGVSLVLAFSLRSVWALVWGHLAGEATRCMLSYVLHPFRPRFRFDVEKAKDLLRFGKWITASTAIIFVLTNGDDAFVGKVLGITALGFYQMAYRISNTPATEVTHVISQVTLSLFSRLQDNIHQIAAAYLRFLRLVALFSFPFAGLLISLAEDITRVVLGTQWMPIVALVQVLSIFGLTRAIGATMGTAILSKGRPDIQSRISLVQLALMALIIYPLTMTWGLEGTTFAVVIPNVVSLVLIAKATKSVIGLPYREIVKPLVMPAVATAIMVACLLSAGAVPLIGTDIGDLVIKVICSLSLYACGIFVLGKVSPGRLKLGNLETVRWEEKQGG